MNKKHQLAKNTLIIALGKMSTQLIAFVLLPLYTIFLSPAAYGTVDLITTYIILLVPALTIQMEMAAFRFLIDARDDEAAKKRVISNVLQIVGMVLVVGTVIYAVLNLFIDMPYAKLILLNVAVMMFATLFLQMARGLGQNMKFAIGCIIAGMTTLGATLLFIVVMRLGAEGMLLAQAAANFISALYLFFALKIYKYVSWQQSGALKKELVHYSFPLVPNGVSWWVITASDRTIISVMIGVAANGIYAVANKYAAVFTSIFGSFAISWAEAASMHIDSKDRDSFFSDTINASIRFFSSLGLVLIAGLPLVFSLLINAQYSEAYLYIPILIAAAFFNAMVGLYSAIYIAKKLTKQVANSSIVAAVINIGLTLLLVQFIGLWAAAVATAIAYLAMATYRYYDVKKYVTISYEKHIFVLLAIAYIVTTSLYYMNTLWGNIVNAVLVATVVIFLNKSMLKLLRSKVLSFTGRKKRLSAEQEIYKESL